MKLLQSYGKGSMSQYNWKYRIYRNGRKMSSRFADVVPKKVHVRPDPILWYPYTRTRTPFVEVHLMPFDKTAEFSTFLRKLDNTSRRPGFIWKEFKQSIFENWMTDKIHLIGASSGYDSRLIAKAVKELHEQHPGWLGETYFVECAGEAEGFLEIIKVLGFEKNAIVWKPDFTVDYFKDLHKRFNGISAYPMNQWYDFYQQWEQEDIQYISGYGGNVADAMNPNSPYMGPKKKKWGIKGRLVKYFRKQYYYQISMFKQPKYSFHPFWSWRYINATAGNEVELIRTSVMLSDIFVPECRHVKRAEILGEVTENGHRTVNRKVLCELYDWYRSTSYGKRNDITPIKTIEYNKWWLQLCIANYAKANNISVY